MYAQNKYESNLFIKKVNKKTSEERGICFEPIVLPSPQRGIDYYDDMYVSLPDNKCAVQDGTYKYETKNETIKTVPRIRWEYKYKPKNKDKALVQLEEYLEDLKLCRHSYDCQVVDFYIFSLIYLCKVAQEHSISFAICAFGTCLSNSSLILLCFL